MRIGRVTGDDSTSPSSEGSVLTWTAVILPGRGLSSHRLCAHLTVKPYARVGCVSSTAAKYSSGATLRRSVGSPAASLTCTAPVGDIFARGSGGSGAMPRSRLLPEQGCFEVSCLCTSNQESREVARRSVLVRYITASAAAPSMSASVTPVERAAPMLARAVKCNPAKDRG